jgi:hypothetical protein
MYWLSRSECRYCGSEMPACEGVQCIVCEIKESEAVSDGHRASSAVV